MRKEQKTLQQQNKALKEHIKAVKGQEQEFTMEGKALQQEILVLWEENKAFKEQLKALHKGDEEVIQEKDKAPCEKKKKCPQ